MFNLTFKNNSNKEERPRVVLVSRCIVQNDEGKFLLIKRSGNNYHLPLKWEFPGGKLDEGQDLSNALEREVLEETGLLIQPTDRMVFVESEIIPKGKFQGLPYVVITGLAKKVGRNEVTLSEEHIDFRWVTTSEAFDMDLKPEVRKALIVLEQKL